MLSRVNATFSNPDEPVPAIGRPRLIPDVRGASGQALNVLVAGGARLWAQPATVPLPDLVADLLSPPMGRLLWPMCFENHRDPAGRRSGFDALELPFASSAYKTKSRLSAAESEAYVQAVLAAQAERGATIVLTPAHHVRRVGSNGRENDLDMAERSRAIFDEEQLVFPAPDDPWQLPRRLFAHILAPLDAITDSSGHELLARYAAADVDGYVVGLARFDERTPTDDVYAAAWWLGELQRRTGRPVVTQGSGNLHLAFGREGLAGACVRTDAAPRLPWPAGPSNKPTKRVQRVFHPTALAEVSTDPPRDQTVSVADVLFRERPCDCGWHEPAEPPTGLERAPHTLACRLRLWREATGSDVAVAADEWSAREREARRTVRRFGIVDVRDSWWASVRQGLQDAREGRRRTG
jgi:hypothetical protein